MLKDLRKAVQSGSQRSRPASASTQDAAAGKSTKFVCSLVDSPAKQVTHTQIVPTRKRCLALDPRSQ